MLTGIHSSRARLKATLTCLLAGALVAVLLGCGGSSSNGVASKSATEILAASKAAVASASSVHVMGKTTQGRLSASLDLTLSTAGGTAQVSLPGGSFELIRIGETLYLKANPALYRTLGISAPAGTWLKAPTGNAQVGTLVVFTELAGEVDNLLRTSGEIVKGSVTTANGQPAIELKQRTQVYSGKLYVATTGKPYPIKLVDRGLVAGQISFSEWNKPVSLSAPAKTIDIGEVKAAG